MSTPAAGHPPANPPCLSRSNNTSRCVHHLLTSYVLFGPSGSASVSAGLVPNSAFFAVRQTTGTRSGVVPAMGRDSYMEGADEMSSTTAVTTRRLMLLFLGGAAALLAGLVLASPAFACIPSQTLHLSPSSGEPGSTVTVVGGGWMGSFSADGEAEIYWGSGANGGDLLATVQPAKDGTWSTTITVPADAAAGAYVVNARQVIGEEVHHSTNQAFEVLASPSGSSTPAPAEASAPAPAMPDEPAPAITQEPAASTAAPASTTEQAAPAPAAVTETAAAPATSAPTAPSVATATATESTNAAPAAPAAAAAAPEAPASVAAFETAAPGLSPAAVAALKASSEAPVATTSAAPAALDALKAAAQAPAPATPASAPFEAWGLLAAMLALAGGGLVLHRATRDRRLLPAAPA